ncbi:MAG: ATP-grasp domain-containing protein [Proteobacteria bacterium]|nr:ATP-grasp domain-containing protein [Pseudomonadota bacterium]
MDKKTILVFPCGSEIGLEIHRSLRYSRHVKLIGGSSVEDHGKFVYENYMGDIPFITDPTYIPFIRHLVEGQKIDAMYPSMDSVITILTENRESLRCELISSPLETVRTCSSKAKTYERLRHAILTPKVYKSIEEIDTYPVFIKPEIGYGTRGARKIINAEQARCHMEEYPNCMILEYLPGKEFTVDCFTDRKGKLLFAGPRERRRIMNGISVNTISLVPDKRPFEILAEKINKYLSFRGAWFFQVKERGDGELVLLEVAARLGGSSALYRNLGINFALLSIFDAFDEEVKLLSNNIKIELDRALDNCYELDFTFDEVYIDLDDCLVISDKVNTNLISFIYKCINNNIKVILLTRHVSHLGETLKKFRLNNVFDFIVNIKDGLPKSHFIKSARAILIDDSFAERKEVKDVLGIPAFAPDAVECLF